MSDIELLNEKKSKEVFQKPTNEQKSLLQLIRCKRAENEKFLKDNESRKKEVKNLKSENDHLIKYLEDKKAYIEANVLDLFQFYNEKEAQILKEQESVRAGLDNQISDYEARLTKKKLENSSIEQKLSQVEQNIKKIDEEKLKIDKIKQEHEKVQKNNQNKIFELIEKLNVHSNLEFDKKSIESKRHKYKMAAIKYLETAVQAVVSRNSDLNKKFTELKLLNEKCTDEREKINEKNHIRKRKALQR